jgi:hypothetical protein
MPRQLEFRTPFVVTCTKGVEKGILRLSARDKLEAQGTLQLTGAANVVPGDVLQEQIRAIPKDVTLRVGLDRSLGSEMESAKRSLQAIPRMEALPLLQQEVHIILGRQDGRVGLFTPGFDLLPESPGMPGEAVTAAVTRLRTKFNLLLAAQILKLMLNTSASRLKVSAAVRVADSQDLLAQAFTVRGGGQPLQTLQTRSDGSMQLLAQLKVGKKLQIVVQNQEAHELYVGIVFFSPNGSVLPLPTEQLLQSGQEVQIPAQDGIELQPPLGVAEILIVASTVSLEKALSALTALSNPQMDSRGGAATVDAVSQLLDDLDAGTRGASKPASDPTVRLVDTRQMAALSIAFEIVA